MLRVARTAADELERLAERFESKAFFAIASLARGRVLLAEADATGARPRFENAIRLWNEIGAPYETAIARQGLAAAHLAAGHGERAELELGAARSTLQRIGAGIRPPVIAAEAPATDSANKFVCDGDTWLVTFDGRETRLRHLKGFHYLAHLFGKAGQEIHALQLVACEIGDSESGADLGNAGTLLDPKAKEMYRRRLAEITEDIEAASARGDLGRASRAENERDFLVRELSRAVGLGGRDRVASSASERARVSATRAVRQAIERVREHLPALAVHLDRTVKTGTYFAYESDPRAPVNWVL